MTQGKLSVVIKLVPQERPSLNQNLNLLNRTPPYQEDISNFRRDVADAIQKLKK